MYSIVERLLKIFLKFVFNILKCGPIPTHVAFIMDGNRRYAEQKRVLKKEGHARGRDKCCEYLRLSIALGIKELTFYGFSIENFKRSQEEINAIFELVSDFIEKILDQRVSFHKDGVCIRCIGSLYLLPKKLQKLFAKTLLLTKDNNRLIVNVALAYTSREEITQTIKCLVQGVDDNLITAEDISEELISACLYTRLSSDPDLLIRTSGEVRLSDFLLWQLSNTTIWFTDVLWPKLNFWHFFSCIFSYQRSASYRKMYTKNKEATAINPRAESFIKFIEEKRWQQLQTYAEL